MSLHRPLRTHQAQIAAIVRAIAFGQAPDVMNILVAHPDRRAAARFRHSVETEQGTVAKRVKPRGSSTLSGWLLDQLAAHEREDGIVPLKRCTGDKPRAQMSLSELEAALSWLERNRLADHADVLKGDPRFGWTVRQRREWRPPVGRADGKPRGASKRATQPSVSSS